MTRLILVLALLVGCVPLEPAIRHAEIQEAANAGHAADESLPLEARQIGAANARAWAAQRDYLSGDAVAPVGS